MAADTPAGAADCLCRLCGHKFRLDQGRPRSAHLFECHQCMAVDKQLGRNLGEFADELRGQSPGEQQNFFSRIRSDNASGGRIAWKTVRAALISSLATRQIHTYKQEIEGKMHLAIHLADQCKMWGKLLDCFCCERKHRAYKSYAHSNLARLGGYARSILLKLNGLDSQPRAKTVFAHILWRDVARLGSLLRGETSFRVRSTSWTRKRPWKSREPEWSTANTSWKQMFWGPTGAFRRRASRAGCAKHLGRSKLWRFPGFCSGVKHSSCAKMDLTCGSCNEKNRLRARFSLFRKSSRKTHTST